MERTQRGALTSRTQAGFFAVQDVRRVFALANPGLQIDTFDDGECAVQSDSSTCAAYNATLLAHHRLPSEPQCCAADAAVSVMVDLAHAALRHRQGACHCPDMLGYGPTAVWWRRWRAGSRSPASFAVRFTPGVCA